MCNTRDDPDGSRTAEKLRTKNPMCSFMNFVVSVTDLFHPSHGKRPWSVVHETLLSILPSCSRRRRPIVIPTERHPVPVGNDLFINWDLSSIKLPESVPSAIALKYIVDSVIYMKGVAYNKIPFSITFYSTIWRYIYVQKIFLRYLNLLFLILKYC